MSLLLTLGSLGIPPDMIGAAEQGAAGRRAPGLNTRAHDNTTTTTTTTITTTTTTTNHNKHYVYYMYTHYY